MAWRILRHLGWHNRAALREIHQERCGRTASKTGWNRNPNRNPDIIKHVAVGQAIEVIAESDWWAHLDSNQGPTGYEPVALTN